MANRTLDGSQPDWEAIGHVDAPDGAPNILVVLIDDAGFGNPATFGGPIDTPNYTRLAEGALRYNRPRGRAVLAHESGPAHRPQQPRRRLRLRWASSRPASPAIRRSFPTTALLPEDSAGQRVQHRGVRQGT